MIWLALLLLLATLGLPWFAALGWVLVGFLAWVSLDPAVAIMEFSRLREYETLLALPLLLLCSRLLADAGQARSLGPSFDQDRPLRQSWLQWPMASMRGFHDLAESTCQTAPSTGSTERLPAASVLDTASGHLLAPGLHLIVVGLLLQMLGPARAPDFQGLFLAALVPALLLKAVASFKLRRMDSATRSSASTTASAEPWMTLSLLVLVVGFYAGLWALLEAAAVATVILLAHQLAARRGSLRHLAEQVFGAMLPFGVLAMLLGLGLGWAMLAGDSGLSREWSDALGHLAGMPSFAPVLASAGFWLLSSVLLRPLPALILGAPLVIPAALNLGVPPEQLAVVTVLALHGGELARSFWTRGGARRNLPAMLLLLLAIVLLGLWPGLSLWLPGQFLP